MPGLIKRTLTSCIFVTTICCSPSAQSDPDSPAESLALQFERQFELQVEDRDYPAAAFAIVTADHIIRARALGHTDASRKVPVDENTVFRLASVSKTIAAGTLTLLIDEGRMGLEDPLVRYMPEFRIAGDSSQVRIRHLLEHSTGIVPHAYDNLIEDGLSTNRILGKFSELPYVCSPGSCYGYQNFLFALIGPAAESVTGTDWNSLVERRIFRPLDMKTASQGYEALVNNPNHAKPHVRSRGRWKTVPVLPNYYEVAPAAGVNASIMDVAKWVRAQLGSHPEIIPPSVTSLQSEPRMKTRREMYRSYWRDMLTDAHYGLGWRVYQLGEHRVIYHGGWVRGYRADVAWSPELQLGMAILFNVEGNSISALTTSFWEMAFQLMKDPAGIQPAGP